MTSFGSIRMCWNAKTAAGVYTVITLQKMLPDPSIHLTYMYSHHPSVVRVHKTRANVSAHTLCVCFLDWSCNMFNQLHFSLQLTWDILRTRISPKYDFYNLLQLQIWQGTDHVISLVLCNIILLTLGAHVIAYCTSLRGIFIHEENMRGNIQLTMMGLAVDLSWLNLSYTEILLKALGESEQTAVLHILKSFIRNRYRSWVGLQCSITGWLTFVNKEESAQW